MKNTENKIETVSAEIEHEARRTQLHKLYLENEMVEREAAKVRCMAAMLYTSYFESETISVYCAEISQPSDVEAAKQAIKEMREHFDDGAMMFSVLQDQISALESGIKKLSAQIGEAMGQLKN